MPSVFDRYISDMSESDRIAAGLEHLRSQPIPPRRSRLRRFLRLRVW